MKRKGISLIVLIITIVIVSILASAVIYNINKTDVIDSAYEMKLKNDILSMKEELQDYISHQEHEYVLKGDVYSKEDLNVTGSNALYKSEQIEGISSIYDIIPSMNNSTYRGAFKIEGGKLVFDEANSERSFSEQEQEWIQEVI